MEILDSLRKLHLHFGISMPKVAFLLKNRPLSALKNTMRLNYSLMRDNNTKQLALGNFMMEQKQTFSVQESPYF